MATKLSPKKTERDPLVITVSELRALSEVDQQAFRSKGGTVISDPVAVEPAEDPAADPEPK